MPDFNSDNLTPISEASGNEVPADELVAVPRSMLDDLKARVAKLEAARPIRAATYQDVINALKAGVDKAEVSTAIHTKLNALAQSWIANGIDYSVQQEAQEAIGRRLKHLTNDVLAHPDFTAYLRNALRIASAEGSFGDLNQVFNQVIREESKTRLTDEVVTNSLMRALSSTSGGQTALLSALTKVLMETINQRGGLSLRAPKS